MVNRQLRENLLSRREQVRNIPNHNYTNNYCSTLEQYQSLLLQYSTVNKTWTVTEEEGPVPMVTGAMALLGIK